MRPASGFILLLSGLLAGCSSSSYEIPDGVRPVSQPALNNLDAEAQEKIKTACAALIRIQDGQQDLPAREQLATQYAQAGQLLHAYEILDEAAICYNNAILLEPQNNLQWHYLLAQLHRSTNNKTAAVEHLQEALRIASLRDKPSLELLQAIHYYLGDTHLSLNQIEESQLAFEKALELKDNPIIHWGLGKTTMVTDPSTAIDHFNSALQMSPNAKSVHYSLMMAYNKVGNRRQAKIHEDAFHRGHLDLYLPDSLMESVEALKETVAALRSRGDTALFTRGDYPSAIQLYTAAIKKAPQDPSLHLNLGLARLRMGQVPAAKAHFNDTLAINPNNSRALTNLALIALAQDDRTTASSLLKRAVEAEPNNHEIRQTFVTLLIQSDKPAEALPHLNHILDRSPANQQALTGITYCLLTTREVEQALQYLNTALTLFPDNRALAYYGVYAYAWADSQTQDLPRAQELLEKTDSSIKIVAEGYLLAGQGKFEEAVASEQRLETRHNLAQYEKSMPPQLIHYDAL